MCRAGVTSSVELLRVSSAYVQTLRLLDCKKAVVAHGPYRHGARMADGHFGMYTDVELLRHEHIGFGVSNAQQSCVPATALRS